MLSRAESVFSPVGEIAGDGGDILAEEPFVCATVSPPGCDGQSAFIVTRAGPCRGW